MTTQLSHLKQWYAKHVGQIQDDFFTFLRFPSISTDPTYKPHLRQTALWVETYLKNIGFKTELWETDYHPVVFGSHIGDPSRPTVLIYHHYDVQPVDPLDEWKSPPFEPTIRDNKVYARGASDNKGQCFSTLTALKAVFELSQKIDLNIKLFIEGEEESGSRGSTDILQKKREALQANHLLIVDMGLPATQTPALTLGLRGIVALEVACRNSSVDLHSGILGGIALNPNRALIQLLAQLWDSKGTIIVPGFYDNVKPFKEELKDFEQTVDEAFLKTQFGIKAFQKENGYSLWEANTTRPTLEINGMAGGYTGVGFKTVIPAVARAKISCRLVPEQDPTKVAELIAKHLKAMAPSGLEIDVSWEHGGKAIRSSATTPISQICIAAYEEVFGKPCRKILCGGSVPIVPTLVEATGGAVAMIGVSLNSNDTHAPNENFGWDQLEQGYLTIGSILGRLAKL